MKEKYNSIKTGFPKFRKVEERFEAELLFYKHPFSPVRFTNVPKERVKDLIGADPNKPTVYQSLSEALCAVKERKTAKPDSEWRVIDKNNNEIMLHQVQNKLDRLSVDSLDSMQKWNIEKFTKSRKQIWPTCIKELNKIVLGIKPEETFPANYRKKRKRKSNTETFPQAVSSMREVMQPKTRKPSNDNFKVIVEKAVAEAMKQHRKNLLYGLPAIILK